MPSRMEVNYRLRRDLEARRPKTCATGEICGFSALERIEALSRDILHNHQEFAYLHKRKMFLIRRQIINNEMVFLIGNAVVITMH